MQEENFQKKIVFPQCTVERRKSQYHLWNISWNQLIVEFCSYLVKTLISRVFCWKTMWKLRKFTLHTVEKREIISHQIFFSSNQVSSNLFSKAVSTFTEFLPKMHERESRNFHTVPSFTHFRQKLCESNTLLKKLLNSWFDEFFSGERKFH